MKKKLIILAGPTASGKSELSLKLAGKIGAEIVCADSMQVYKGMDIGSAKLMPDERCGIPHHLIDVADPREPFDVVTYQRMAKAAFFGIWDRERVPLIVGGTGFYIQAVLYDIDFTEADGEVSLREKYAEIAGRDGPNSLYAMLLEADPLSAERIHPHNVKRVIRALEYYEKTGESIAVHNERERKKSSPYNFTYFVLTDDRDRLYERIEERVDSMILSGLTEEVKRLKEAGCRSGMLSMKGLGYRELTSYLDEEIGFDEAVRQIKLNTRHYAKRQLTWFRREPEAIWIDRSDYEDDEEILDTMLRAIQ